MSTPVVVATGSDANFNVDHLVNEPMPIGDPARPVAGEVVLEGFGSTSLLSLYWIPIYQRLILYALIQSVVMKGTS